MTAEGKSKCFGLVNIYNTKPKRRVFDEELREKFDEWYPGFNAQSEGQARAA
jgi:hypothetical protein